MFFFRSTNLEGCEWFQPDIREKKPKDFWLFGVYFFGIRDFLQKKNIIGSIYISFLCIKGIGTNR